MFLFAVQEKKEINYPMEYRWKNISLYQNLIVSLNLMMNCHFYFKNICHGLYSIPYFSSDWEENELSSSLGLGLRTLVRQCRCLRRYGPF
jgi:hypothetical protein